MAAERLPLTPSVVWRQRASGEAARVRERERDWRGGAGTRGGWAWGKRAAWAARRTGADHEGVTEGQGDPPLSKITARVCRDGVGGTGRTVNDWFETRRRDYA